MRLHIGQPPATPDFTPQDDGWTPLKEPSPWVLNLVATPIGLLTAVLLAIAWGDQHARFEFGSTIFGAFLPLVLMIVVVIGFAVLIAVHEMIHALCYPKFGFTTSTMIAFWPSKLLFLAITYDALRRNRLLLVYVMPFLVISVLPLVVCRTLEMNSGLLMVTSTMNAMFCGGDIFCIFLILFQVPQNAILRNQGWATWWKVVNRCHPPTS